MWNKAVIFLACVLIYFYKRSARGEGTSILFYYKFFLYYFATFIVTALCWPLFLLKPRNVQNVMITVPIAKFVSRAINLRWIVRGGGVLSEDRGAVVVSNHQSSLDILEQLNIWDLAGKMTCIAKKELFYLWPFGLSAYLTGIVFIDRRKTKEAYKTMFAASEVMTKDETKIWIFPEGTRNNNPEFLPFKKGAFNLAVASQVPVIPVVFSPYHFLDIEKKTFKEGHVIIQCLEEVSTKGLTQEDVPALIENVRNQMSIVYKQLAKEVMNDPPTKFNLLKNCSTKARTLKD
ncbi:1-acyl-sn-glycerol-3-phosphate acyltransferase beta-like [Ostrinia nubilalis]|uniref:1-acyl-sn-glycerol-3-phosphate acyltransferase beta-like n=1 Tax=Ostrinia nubilalis TaxID=29057 RepID=UPI0030823A05